MDSMSLDGLLMTIPDVVAMFSLILFLNAPLGACIPYLIIMSILQNSPSGYIMHLVIFRISQVA